MKWEDIPLASKLATVVVATCASVVIWMFSTFETSADALRKWNSHASAITCNRVSELRIEKRVLAERLKHDPDNHSLTIDLKIVTEEIDRIDPNGVCP